MQKQQKPQKQPKNPYSGIYLRSVMVGISSFAFMQFVYFTTGNPAFAPEKCVNSAFFFALIAPIVMYIKISMQERRYRIYEEGMGDYKIKVPVSILINKGYLYVSATDIYLVFATTRPHFISSMKVMNVVKVSLYDTDNICLTLKNRTDEAKDMYTIKFRVEDDLEGLMEIFNNMFEGRVENLNKK